MEWAINKLNMFYADQNKPAEAKAMFTRALQGYEEALGSKYISTLNSVNNLGLLYADQGNLAEAEAMYTRALQSKKEEPTQDGTIPNNDSSYNSLESSLPAVSKVTFSINNRPGLFKASELLDKDDSGDIQSTDSVPDDIQSQVSMHRTQQEIAAREQLGELLAQHKELSPLYEIALSKINKERLVGNLRRMLKQYYLDLANTAQINLKKAVVQLLRSRWDRIRISQQIIDIIHPDTADEAEPEILDISNKKSYLES